jgi:hypothetical protein
MVVLVVELIARSAAANQEQKLLVKVFLAEMAWVVKGSFGLAVVVVELVRLAERQLLESVATVAPEKALQYLAVQ